MPSWGPSRPPSRQERFPIEVITEEELTPSYGVRRTMRDALPLLAGMALLMAGSGFTATLLGVRAGLEGFSPTVTGIVLSAFYGGFLAGSLVTPRTIWRVGHVRVFAGLASLMSAAVLVHVIRPDPVSWFALRALSGLCLAGLYVTTETWLNGAATNTTRGTLLAGYTVVVVAAQGVGQLLFPIADPGGHAAFVLGSVLVSVAVVPVSLATVSPPPVLDVERMSFRELYRTAPLAAVSSAAAGFIGAAVLGGSGALYASSVGLTSGQTSAMLFSVLLGALVLQVPFARWSDAVDRRRVMVSAALLAGLAAGVAALAAEDRLGLLVLVAAVAGGMSFPLYALASAHLNDYLEEDRVIPGGAAMVLVYGLGAVAGPVVVSTGIDLVGPEALFILVGAGYATVAGFAVWRMGVRAAVPRAKRAAYAPVPMGTSPTAASLADVSPEAQYPEPAEIAVAATDMGDVGYRVRGAGPPVVLLGNAPDDDDDAWDRLLAALAANGVQAVGVNLRSEVREDPRPREDLLAVLLDLELPSATFVGLNGGAVHIAELAAEHPDRTDALVFAGPALPMAIEDADETDELAEADGAVETDEGAGLGDRALLLLTEDYAVPYWTEPELFADLVAEFVRRPLPVEEPAPG